MEMNWSALGTRTRMALMLASATLWGCATTPTTPELAVRERAGQVWQAKIAGDYDRAYAYMPPSYRAVTSVADYRKTFGGAVRTVAAEVISVKCETQDKCVTEMKVEARAALSRGAAAPIVTHFNETWIRESGFWWLFPTS